MGQTSFPFIPDFKGKLVVADFIPCVYIGAALLLLRLVCEAVFIPMVKTVLEGHNKPNPQKLAVKVFDDAYTSFGAAVMVAWAWALVAFGNGGCTPASITSCLAHWPDIHPSPQDRIYWISMWGFYTYELMGTVLQRGTVLPPIMVSHHVATMVLMITVYTNSMLRVGMMATALLDLSNPLLHAAKTLQHLDISSLAGTKDMLFNIFALVFLVARVVMPPFTILKVCFVDARVLPAAGFYTMATCTVLVYMMQLFWFYKIVRIATKGGKEQKED